MERCDIYLSEESVKEVVSRLSKIEGQIKDLQKMIQEKGTLGPLSWFFTTQRQRDAPPTRDLGM
jgi:hypothetical protein